MVDFDARTEAQILNSVSTENLMEYTGKIASWIRLSGEPDEAKAMAYIRGLLKEFGFRTEIMHHRAYISLPGVGSLTVTPDRGESLQMRCMSHAFGVSTDPEGLTGRLVPGSRKCSYKGNIILLQGMASAKAVREAEELGAIGQIFISDDYLHESSISPLWGVPTTQTIGSLPSTPSVTVVYDDGETLKRMLNEGSVTVTVKTEVTTEWRDIPLLTAELDGTEEDTFLLFSSHVDSWHYGAMDNGSANATAIETARLMAENRSRLRRGLRLAFWSGHSQGRFAGSSWYCDTFWHELMDRCVGHVNVDSTGGKGATVVEELPVMPQSFRVAAEALETATGVRLEGKRIGRFGDQSFYGLGLTSTFATFSEQPKDPTGKSVAFHTGGKKSGGLGWWWHTEYDTLDKVDREFLVRDTKVYVSTIYRLLSYKYLPYDFRQLVSYLEVQVNRVEEEVGRKLDLSPLKQRLGVVQKRLERFYASLSAGDTCPSWANSTMMRLSRALVPCAFKENDRTEPDPFGPIPDFPAFNGVSRLNEVSGDDYDMLLAAYVRRRNRVVTYLTEAAEVLECYTDKN